MNEPQNLIVGKTIKCRNRISPETKWQIIQALKVFLIKFKFLFRIIIIMKFL